MQSFFKGTQIHHKCLRNELELLNFSFFDEISPKEIHSCVPFKYLASLAYCFVFTSRRIKPHGRFRKTMPGWLILLLNGKVGKFKLISAFLCPRSCLLVSKEWLGSKLLPLS